VEGCAHYYRVIIRLKKEGIKESLLATNNTYIFPVFDTGVCSGELLLAQ